MNSPVQREGLLKMMVSDGGEFCAAYLPTHHRLADKLSSCLLRLRILSVKQFTSFKEGVSLSFLVTALNLLCTSNNYRRLRERWC